MKDNLSPEEKLLKLIRGAQKNNPQAHNPPETAAQKQPLWQSAFTRPDKKKRALVLPDEFFTPANLQRILWLVIAVLVVYLVASLVYPLVGLREIKLPKAEPAEKNISETVSQKEAQSLEFYLQSMRDKPLFGGSAEGVSAANIATEAESIKDINLVGVILGDNPQAIIQDKKSEKTTYVSKGQFIGDYQVEEIKEGKVILNRNGQRFELSI